MELAKRCPRCGGRMKHKMVLAGSSKYATHTEYCPTCGDLAYSGRKASPPSAGPFVAVAAIIVVVGVGTYLYNRPEPVKVARTDDTPIVIPDEPKRPATIVIPPIIPRPLPPSIPAPVVTIPDEPVRETPRPPVILPPVVDERHARITALLNESQREQESLKKNQDAEIAARQRLAANPAYIEAVKTERDLNAQVETMRREHQPDIDLSNHWIAAKGDVARIEKSDPTFRDAADAITESLASLAVLRKKIAAETSLAESGSAPGSVTDTASAIAKRELVAGMTYVEACRAARAQGVIAGSQGATSVYRWPVTSRTGSQRIVTGSHFNLSSNSYRNEYEDVPVYEVTSYVEATFTDGKLVSFQKVGMNGQRVFMQPQALKVPR